MACGACGNGSKKDVSFVYTSPKGETKTYRTEIEAQAAQIREHGGTYKTVTK